MDHNLNQENFKKKRLRSSFWFLPFPAPFRRIKVWVHYKWKKLVQGDEECNKLNFDMTNAEKDELMKFETFKDLQLMLRGEEKALQGPDAHKKSSQFRGVRWYKRQGAWRAEISGADGNQIYLGSFDSERDAGVAYDGAAIKRYGMQAITNFWYDCTGDGVPDLGPLPSGPSHREISPAERANIVPVRINLKAIQKQVGTYTPDLDRTTMEYHMLNSTPKYLLVPTSQDLKISGVYDGRAFVKTIPHARLPAVNTRAPPATLSAPEAPSADTGTAILSAHIEAVAPALPVETDEDLTGSRPRALNLTATSSTSPGSSGLPQKKRRLQPALPPTVTALKEPFWAARAKDVCMYCGESSFHVEEGTSSLHPRAMLCCGCCDNGQAHIECIMRFTGQEITLKNLEDDWFCSEACGEIEHYLNRLCSVKQAIRPTSRFPDIKRFSVEVVHRRSGHTGKRAAIQACKILKETFDSCPVGDFDLLEMVSLSLGGDDNYRPSTGYGAALSTQKSSLYQDRANGSGDDDDDDEEEEEDGEDGKEEEGTPSDGADYPFDCSGFRNFVLRENRKIIAVATLRIFGASFAEMPFFTIREAHRGKGYAHLMLKAIEDILCGLQIKYLVVPALRDVERFWRKLGFGRVTARELRLLVDRVVEPDPTSAHLLKKQIYSSSPFTSMPRALRSSLPAAPSTLLAEENGGGDKSRQEGEGTMITPPLPTPEALVIRRRIVPHNLLIMPAIDEPFAYDVDRDSDDCTPFCASLKAHLKV